jgi:uncharacterized protein
VHQQGESTPADPARAAALYERACQGGNPAGCSNFGSLLTNGNGVPIDQQRGLELLRKGCKLGNEWGCNELIRLGEKP